MSAEPATLTWSLVVPVKVLARAKSRLAAFDGPRRAALALAMAADTVAAAVSCPEVARVIAVTGDPQAAAELAALGAVVVGDGPAQGLNPALRHGAALASARWPAAGIGALVADLPALRARDLSEGLRAAAQWRHAFVPDASGAGTTLYTARGGSAFSPRFGPASARRHRAAGAAELALPGLATLRRDVDTPDDLAQAARLGMGPRTAAVAGRLR
jgi:2-phospho-L-lactate/phosphoenolpyruvate guanylyltransferase